MTRIEGHVGIGPGWPPSRSKRPVVVSVRYPFRTTAGDVVIEPVWADVRVTGAGRFAIDDVLPGYIWLRIQHGTYVANRVLIVPSDPTVDYADLVEVDPATLEPLEPMPPSALDILAEAQAAVDAAEAATAAAVASTGEPGASAYQIAVDNGFVGTEAAWLASLDGTDGIDGTDGTDAAEAPGVFADREQTMTMHAAFSSVSPTSGTLDLAYFTARYDDTREQVAAYTASSASAALTLAKMGIYSVDGSGNLTLVATTGNETSAFAASGTRYPLDLLAAVALVKGQRYAIGHLIIGTTMGNRAGMAFPSSTLTAAFGPVNRPSARLAGQTDLPASIAYGSLVNTTAVMYAEVL